MNAPANRPAEGAPSLPTVDLLEYGGRKDGERQQMNNRLYMQLLTFDVAPNGNAVAMPEVLARCLEAAGIASVVYADASAPRGLALLTWSEHAEHFVERVRPLLLSPELGALQQRPGQALLGRTYATGHEPDLEHALLRRSIENALRPEHRWHVWYPLRRKGAFALLPDDEQKAILREHAMIGHAYGQRDLAHDIRLACHGLDGQDNDFIIGLLGHELHPLSHLVATMRKTKQTSTFIERMGPFFVGHVLHRIA